VVVELDGGDGHTTRAQLERDRRRDLILRQHGFIVLRYTWNQVNFDSATVAADLRRTLRDRDAPDQFV
jgi:very-short-patch-repair endonuclease